MKKLFLLFMLCITATAAGATVPDTAIKINLVTELNTHGGPDGSVGHTPYPRTPILAPTVYLDDHTLILCTEFEEDIEVQLLDPDTMDDDEPTVVYSVNVPAGTQQVALPDTYTGEYGIRLVVGQWYFVGTVCL